MCGIAQKANVPGSKQVAKFYDGSTAFGKFSSRADPFGAYAATGQKDKLDPLNLKNAPDDIPLPPALQEAKDPDSMALRRKSRGGNAGGTLLTSPSGVAPSLLNTGGTTLLGG
jgi:hypothetical protein